MDDLLDDEFAAFTSVLTEEERAQLKDKIPFVILKGEALADVSELLIAAGIDFDVQRQQATTNNTGIVPLSALQLDLVDCLIYIAGKDKEQADQLMQAYEEKRRLKQAQETTISSKNMYLVLFVLIIILLAWTYFKAFYLKWS